MRTENLIHPGEILREEFMRPLEISQTRLAIDLNIPSSRVAEIVNERRSISPDTALRLGKYFGTGPEFWANLQSQYDLARTFREEREDLEKIIVFS